MRLTGLLERCPAMAAVALIALWAAPAAALPELPPPAQPYDPYALPDAPAPPTLPDLTHRALALSLETTFASIKSNPNPDGTQPSRTAAWLERLEGEYALSIRRWYLGAAFEVAAGAPPGGQDLLFVLGHPEIWGRAVWASRAGLAYGGGLGLVPPVVNHADDSRAAAVDSAVRVVRPWDYVDFEAEMLTFRPFIDVRDIDGPITLQLRQGIDWSIPTRDRADLTAKVTSRTTFYLGYRPAQLLGVGLELWEVYLIRAPEVRDDQRAAYAISPSIRFMTRRLQPAVSAIFPFDQPLFGVVDTYWAVRLNLGIVLDPDGAPTE